MFSPIGQGMLTDKYLGGIPEDSRAAQDSSLKRDFLTDENLERVRALNEIAQRRGQALAQLAIAWTLRDPRVTSALIGASSVAQLEQNVAALDNLDVLRRGAGRDRPLRGRLRHQPLGAVQRRLIAARMQRGAFPHLHPITTRWDDNDVYGHVNNVRYFAFFDTAINDWLIREGGLDIERGDVIGVCAESHCAYTAAIAFPDAVEVGLRAGHVGNSSVRYELAVFKAGAEEPAATGWFVHVFVDRATRRPVAAPAAAARRAGAARVTRFARPAGQEQRATSLELFYDLVFVFAITQISHLLLDTPHLGGRRAVARLPARGLVVVELHDVGHERAGPGVDRRAARC